MEPDRAFQDAAVILFREAFEGIPAGQNYTWFVQGKEGIFDALNSTDSSGASKQPTDRCTSLAAHAFHLLFTLRNANTSQGLPEPDGTWESSWSKEAVTESEWDELKTEIRQEYDLYIGWLSSNHEWNADESFEGLLAPLPHVAYHLGAMRQILKTI